MDVIFEVGNGARGIEIIVRCADCEAEITRTPCGWRTDAGRFECPGGVECGVADDGARPALDA